MNPINLTIVKVSPHEIIVETTNIILTKKLCSLQTGVNFWHSSSETLGFSENLLPEKREKVSPAR